MRKSGEAAVDISQVYETSVADRASGHALRFLIVPHRAFTAAIQHDDPSPKDALESVLGLQAIRPISPAALPLAIAGMLQADADDPSLQRLQAEAVLDHLLRTAPPLTPPAGPDAETLAFSEHVAFSALVPFEESPLALVSLASKAAALSKNGVALGAFVGVIAGGATPLLLLTVPAGIILCASAIAFAKEIDAKRGAISGILLGVGARHRPGPSPPLPPAGEGPDDNQPSHRRRR
jgi:hypothetical protein